MANEQAQPNKQQIQVKITDEVMRGFYTNHMSVMHTPEEFVMDFINVFGAHGTVGAKIITNPGHAKRIASALQDNMKKYEEMHGEIKTAAAPQANAGLGLEERG